MALTALLVDVFGALGEGDDLVAGEHPGTVGLLAAWGTEGLPTGVAEVHGVQLLCEGTQLVAGMALAGVPYPPCAPCCPHRLGAAAVTVGTLHVLLAVGRAVHQELQEPVHGG